MKIYSRYVFWNSIKWLIVMSSCSIIGAFIMMGIRSLAEGVPINVAFLILPYVFTEGFKFLIPIAVFAAMYTTFSPMTLRGEITALKIVGVPIWRLLLPIYLVISLICIVNVQVADYSMSTARAKANQKMAHSFQKILVAALKKDYVYSVPTTNLTIEVDGVDSQNKLINPTVMLVSDDSNIKADNVRFDVKFREKTNLVQGKKQTGKEENTEAVVVIDAQNAKIVSKIGVVDLPGPFHLELPFSDFLPEKKREDPHASEVGAKLRDLAKEREEYHRQMAARNSFALICGNVDEASKEEWKYRRQKEKDYHKRMSLYKLVSPRNWSEGFSSLFFAWAAVPLVIMNPKYEIKIGKKKRSLPPFIVLFGIIMFVYWSAYGIVYDPCKRGELHPYFMWTGDVILGIIGAIYLKKIH